MHFSLIKFISLSKKINMHFSLIESISLLKQFQQYVSFDSSIEQKRKLIVSKENENTKFIK